LITTIFNGVPRINGDALRPQPDDLFVRIQEPQPGLLRELRERGLDGLFGDLEADLLRLGQRGIRHGDDDGATGQAACDNREGWHVAKIPRSVASCSFERVADKNPPLAFYEIFGMPWGV
jgi:hypothetical protein